MVVLCEIQMFNQYLDAYDDEDDAAEQFGFDFAGDTTSAFHPEYQSDY